jgi:DNA/RNA-binding domain of Phe-tRNA-synthetase-like protein
MWFILESLAPMPIDALHAAAAELERGLRTMMPDARIEQSFLAAGG